MRAFIDHDRFCNAIVNALPVVVNKELDEPEPTLQSRGSIAESTLDRLPERDLTLLERDDPDSQQALADRKAVGAPDCETGIHNEPNKVFQIVEIEGDGYVKGMALRLQIKVLLDEIGGDVDG